MNIIKQDILLHIIRHGYKNQRDISSHTGWSLGLINKTISELISDGNINSDYTLSEDTINKIKLESPKCAVILAAGCGLRMAPINYDVPKGLIVAKGEHLIERQIKQLHEVGIKKIYIVVGFMKESFEFLIDKYGVELIVNCDYYNKSNLHSLSLASDKFCGAYIVPCDLYFKENPFSKYEYYSWYMLSEKDIEESTIRLSKKREIFTDDTGLSGKRMVGVAYISHSEAELFSDLINRHDKLPKYNRDFWEDAVFNSKGKMLLKAKTVNDNCFTEVNSYEDLRDLDENSKNLNTEAISIISESFNCNVSDIKNIAVLKKGMTNRSFIFECFGKKYIMRIPGEGTQELINRKHEADVYSAIGSRGISDDAVYMNPENGYKITGYFDKARNCDCENEEEVKKCMQKLREFHELGLKVAHEFSVFSELEFYESLWNDEKSVYSDYETTKNNVLRLRKYIENHIEKKTLCHIDSVPDNFLFIRNENGEEEIKLIDWEYAGMQDPHIDIAMFAIYSMYDREKIDKLIDFYFVEGCDPYIRIKIYCYIAVCGLLWSNWCEYKRQLGVEFGEYSLRQYRYAKEYSRIAISGIEKIGEQHE